jgi:hypothetical protein
MKYLYIENYMQLSNTQKVSFLEKLKDIKVSSLEMIFSEGSLLVSFLEEKDKNKAYSKISNFFSGIKNIKIDFVEKLLLKGDKKVISFKDKDLSIRI